MYCLLKRLKINKMSLGLAHFLKKVRKICSVWNQKPILLFNASGFFAELIHTFLCEVASKLLSKWHLNKLRNHVGSMDFKRQFVKCFFLKKWANPGLFFIYFRIFKHTLQILQQIGVWKLSIQYTVPGFELTTKMLKV